MALGQRWAARGWGQLGSETLAEPEAGCGASAVETGGTGFRPCCVHSLAALAKGLNHAEPQLPSKKIEASSGTHPVGGREG